MFQQKEHLDQELKVDERNLDDSDIEEDKSEQVQMEDDNDFDADFDDFGDFTNFEEATETEVDENLSKEPKEPVPFVPPLNLDEDNDDDDDFGDFEEPEAFSEAKNNEKFEASFASCSPSCKVCCQSLLWARYLYHWPRLCSWLSHGLDNYLLGPCRKGKQCYCL